MLINLIKDEKKLIEFDSGFYFGKGLFETILVIDKPIFLEEHLSRLNSGLIRLNINTKIDREMILENIQGVKNCALKLMVSEENIVLSKRELNYKQSQYDNGFKLKLSKLRRDPNSHMVKLKSFNYMDNTLERELALKEGFDEAIFLNTENFLCEGSVSNLFIVMEDCIITPLVECGLLDGIVRSFIIKELGRKYNIIEEKIPMENIEKCKGIFITNSLMGVMWVNSFDDLKLSKTTVSEEIKDYYDRYIGCDTNLNYLNTSCLK